MQDAISRVIDGGIVSGDEQGDTCLPDDVLEKLDNLARGLRVEVAGWLIGDHKTRRMHERPRQGHALLLTAGEFQAAVMGAHPARQALEPHGRALPVRFQE